MKIYKYILFVLLISMIASTAKASKTETIYIDPSGQWASPSGSLSLMLTEDALSFSYSAVFGPSAHTCDGAGVAALDTNYKIVRYLYADEDGNTIKFIITKDEIRMEPVSGSVSFCGMNWPGDTLKRVKKPFGKCKVTSKKAYFYTVDEFPPEKRRAYVVSGDILETLPLENLDGDDYVLARYKGSKRTTVGLIRRADIECTAKK